MFAVVINTICIIINIMFIIIIIIMCCLNMMLSCVGGAEMGVSRETSFNKYGTPQLHREYEQLKELELIHLRSMRVSNRIIPPSESMLCRICVSWARLRFDVVVGDIVYYFMV